MCSFWCGVQFFIFLCIWLWSYHATIGPKVSYKTTDYDYQSQMTHLCLVAIIWPLSWSFDFTKWSSLQDILLLQFHTNQNKSFGIWVWRLTALTTSTFTTWTELSFSMRHALLSRKSNGVCNPSNTSSHSSNVFKLLCLPLFRTRICSWWIIQNFLLSSGFLIFSRFTTVAVFRAVCMSGDQRGALDTWWSDQFRSVWHWGSIIPVTGHSPVHCSCP